MLFDAQGQSIYGNRIINQDNMYANGEISCETLKNRCIQQDELLCFAVADGVGGASKGEEASRLALEEVRRWQEEGIAADICESIQAAFDRFNQAIVKFSAANYIQAATTLTLLAFQNNKFYLANVGDSPAFLVREKQLLQLSERQGEGNRLIMFLGNEEAEGSEMVHISKGTVFPGDRFFICTDGITNALSEEQLRRQLLKRNASIKKIIAKTINNMPADNCTGILIKTEESR